MGIFINIEYLGGKFCGNLGGGIGTRLPKKVETAVEFFRLLRQQQHQLGAAAAGQALAVGGGGHQLRRVEGAAMLAVIARAVT